MGKKKKPKTNQRPASSAVAAKSMLYCSHCRSNINDFGGCDGCGRALDTDELTREVTSPGSDDGIDFAAQFISPTLRILVGPAKVEYYLHKQTLISKSPYFATLLSSPFAGVETATGTVTLDSEVDTDDAFQMFVEYLYLSDYDLPEGLGKDQKCLLHASVYVFAERLCMNDLKRLALEKMVPELAGAYGGTKSYCGGDVFDWGNLRPLSETFGDRLQTQTVVQLVEKIYTKTPDPCIQLNCDRRNSMASDNGCSTAEKLSEEALVSSEPTEMVGKVEVRDTTFSGLVCRDKMRRIIARYAASNLGRMKGNKDFMELVRTKGEFAEDLVNAAKDGDQVGSDELQKM